MNPLIVMDTRFGCITVELDALRAPVTSAHFLSLILRGMLRDASFYRVVHRSNTPGTLPTIDVIQGGLGFERAGTLPAVRLEPTSETGLAHRPGTLSLARGHQDATGEFFICLGEHPVLDAGGTDGPGAEGFAAFGQVLQGMDVVRTIHGLAANAPPPAGAEFLAGQFLTEPVPVRLRAGDSTG